MTRPEFLSAFNDDDDEDEEEGDSDGDARMTSPKRVGLVFVQAFEAFAGFPFHSFTLTER